LDGKWNFSWKYNDGSKTYTFNVLRHYLTGMNFSLEKDPTMLILPNGFGLIYDKESLLALKNAVDISLENTADECIEMYLSGEEVTEEESADNESDYSEQAIEKETKEKGVSAKKNKKQMKA